MSPFIEGRAQNYIEQSEAGTRMDVYMAIESLKWPFKVLDALLSNIE